MASAGDSGHHHGDQEPFIRRSSREGKRRRLSVAKKLIDGEPCIINSELVDEPSILNPDLTSCDGRDDEEPQEELHKPYQYWNLALLGLTFSMSQSTMSGHMTISPIISERMGFAKLATLPVAAVDVGSMASAWYVGSLMQRRGRKCGFVFGEIMGIIGCSICIVGLQLKSFPLLNVGGFFLGCWCAASFYVRFVAAGVVGSRLKGRAVSWVLIGSSLCASVGPLISSQTANLLPTQFTAFYLVAASLALLSLLMAHMMRITDDNVNQASEPSKSGGKRPHQRQIEQKEDFHENPYEELRGSVGEPPPDEISTYELIRPFRVRVAIWSAATAMFTMILIMSATSLAMHNSMFIPCFFTAEIIELMGKELTIVVGSFLLGASRVAWNFQFIASTRLLVSEFDEKNAARVEGVNEVFVQGAGALGALASGYLVSISWRMVLWFAVPFVFVNIRRAKVAKRDFSNG
eukprot:jgi/Bigna1/66395/fgenesh1_pg.1_\